MVKELFLPEKIQVQEVQFKTEGKQIVKFFVARLDAVHPIVSGNKLFKLFYNLQTALAHQKGIITMGGAYSNHLAATAYACKIAGISSIGIVRGEVSTSLNHTLQFCKEHGMELIPMERKHFHRSSSLIQNFIHKNPSFLFVPEGGDNQEGMQGCEEIPKRIPDYSSYTHIICAAGTGTTIRGITRASAQHQHCIAIPVLKIKSYEQQLFRVKHLHENTTCLFGYAGKGYARKDKQLFSFMNNFFKQSAIPLDFIYTAKLLKAVSELYDSNYFTNSSRLLVIHTGGLQGNESLTGGTLVY